MKNNNDVAMTWRMRCLTRSVTIINATLQLLDIYIYIYIYIYIDQCYARVMHGLIEKYL